MGLSYPTKLVSNEDGTFDTLPADRFRVARIPYGYVVVDTGQAGTPAMPDGFIVWSSAAAEAKTDVDALRSLKAEAQAVAAEHNAAHPPLDTEG